MQCTSASIFGLEAAALYLYCDRGSVVKLVTMAPWRCAEVGDGTPATMTFFHLQSSCRAVVPQVSIEEHCAKREVLSEGHVNFDFTRRRQC